MSTAYWTGLPARIPVSEIVLKFAAQCWFVIAVAGQWIFVSYVIAFYGGSAIHGNLEAWNKVLPHGYVPGRTMSNLATASHLLLAVVIMVGGPLQLIPRLRRIAPAFHRWNGRIYLPAVVLTSLGGLYMVWSRNRGNGQLQRIGISVDAALIVLFAALTLRSALARDLTVHRKWALRLFMVVNAGWFFRIGLMQWVLLHHGPAGFDPETFTGPFLDFLAYADYLLPLAVLELYLLVRDRGSASGRYATAAALVLLTVATAIGIFAATMALWLPHIAAATS